jgi:CPA2 family monovalent cation:H+ antiporter-2
MKNRHPQVPLLVRAFDQVHYYQLKQAGAEFVVKETYYSALDMGCQALIQLGFKPHHAEQLKTAFITTENQTSDDMFESWVASEDSGMSPSYRQLFMQQEQSLREVMQGNRNDGHGVTERDLNPSLKIYGEHLTKDSESG